MSERHSKIRFTFSITLGAVIFFLLQTSLNYAQTTAEQLQSGVEIYNAMREYVDGLNVKTLTQQEVDDAKARMDKGLAILDKVIREGNAEEIRTSRYFRTNFKYQYGFVLGAKGQNAKAYEVFKDIETDMTGYVSGDFPLRYQFFDKNYVIKWENFSATQAEYLTGFAEICTNLDKLEDAVRVNKKALAHPGINNWLKYIAVNKMLDIYGKNQSLFNEQEVIDFSIQAIKSYYVLSESEKQTVADFNYPTIKRGVTNVLERAEKNMPAAMARTAETALAAQTDKTYVKVLQLFEITYRNNQPVDYAFHEAAQQYARDVKSLDAVKARYVGVTATDRIAQATSNSNCQALQTVIDLYTYWNETGKVNEYMKKRQNCLDEQEKAQKRAAKQAKRSNRNFNFYTGAYIFPLIKSNPKRDYGLAANLVFKKTALEFSYLKINMNKENIFDMSVQGVDDAEQSDLSRWDGFYAHFQPKFFTNKGGYIGPLFGYAQKEFETFDASYTNDGNGTFGSTTFQPKEKQYILMANFGGMALGRGFGADFYMGIGATYNQWDWGNALSNDDITVDNPVLENRKDAYFGLIIRVGMTMGLNFGKGNL
ncbi:MAG: hypothetical protein JNJ57_16260 [Saprospiraceae bacterium]|nr:hypothetical protein [Saprospiraceae bacterium]